jgi:hypothetical protein
VFSEHAEQTVFRSWLLTNGPKHGARWPIDQTTGPSFSRLVLKIQQQPHRTPDRTQIGQELRFVNRQPGWSSRPQQAGRRLLRVLREHRVLRESGIHPARANGTIFPVNMHKTLDAR